MPDTGPVTLDRLAKMIPPVDLTAWCPPCGRHATIPLVAALRRYDRNTPVPEVRAVCSCCGAVTDVRPRYNPDLPGYAYPSSAHC